MILGDYYSFYDLLLYMQNSTLISTAETTLHLTKTKKYLFN